VIRIVQARACPTTPAASGNPVLGVPIDMLGSLFRECRSETIRRVADLREAAEAHRWIDQAIRARDHAAAVAAVGDHLRDAKAAPTAEAAREIGARTRTRLAVE
jgi:DNA-binding FadR family transcriptional regulator